MFAFDVTKVSQEKEKERERLFEKAIPRDEKRFLRIIKTITFYLFEFDARSVIWVQ